MSTPTYAAAMQGVARLLLGKPNLRLSKKGELRYGSKGSVSISLEKGTWYDHESGTGGGVVDLIARQNGCNAGDALGWLVEHGLAQAEQRHDVVYDYEDEQGELLFQVVRRPGPKFLQRRPQVGGGYTYKLGDVRQVPYRLKQLLAAPSDEVVFIVEGEKDVDNLRACGLQATCNSGGAKKWRPHHASHLIGRNVVILPDNDPAGFAHAEVVQKSLTGIAKSMKKIKLPGLPLKGDVSDWLADGGTREQLEALCRQAREVMLSDGPMQAVSLLDVMAQEPKAWPHVMSPYFPCGVATLLGGHGGLGKSMLGLVLAAHVAAGSAWGPFEIERQGKVVFLSFEDGAHVLRCRLRRIIDCYGLQLPAVMENLIILDGSDADTELAIEKAGGIEFTPLASVVKQAVAGACFVVVDNATDTFGGNEISRRQVRQFVRYFSQLAKANDSAVVLLAHVDKQAAKSGGKGNSFSGSTAWHNGPRSRLALVEDGGIIRLLHEKANLGEKGDPLVLARSEFGVLVLVDPETRTAQRAAHVESDRNAVLKVMNALSHNRINIPTAETGQNTTYHVLKRAPEMPQHLTDSKSKDRVKAAVLALERSREIVRETYRSHDRKTKERWTLAQTLTAIVT